MLGLMMDKPLLISSVLDYAAKYHGGTEIVSRTVEGPIHRYTYADGIDDFYTQSARVGVAPYIGNYGDLHTWLMLQIEHSPESEDHYTVTPMVRLFKDVHLFEAGMNTRGEVLFNYIFRYFFVMSKSFQCF